MLKQLFFGGPGTGSKQADIGLALLRVYAGLAMALTHGLAKLRNPDMIIEGTRGMGFPAPTLFGWMAILAEFGGGLLLALGLLTRPAAFFIAVTMGVAAFVRQAGDPFTEREAAMLYLVVALLYLIAGPGRLSVDALVHQRRRAGAAR